MIDTRPLDQLLVAFKVDFARDATVADIERAADAAERRPVSRHPEVRYVFLDPTHARPTHGADRAGSAPRGRRAAGLRR